MQLEDVWLHLHMSVHVNLCMYHASLYFQLLIYSWTEGCVNTIIFLLLVGHSRPPYSPHRNIEVYSVICILHHVCRFRIMLWMDPLSNMYLLWFIVTFTGLYSSMFSLPSRVLKLYIPCLTELSFPSLPCKWCNPLTLSLSFFLVTHAAHVFSSSVLYCCS